MALSADFEKPADPDGDVDGDPATVEVRWRFQLPAAHPRQFFRIGAEAKKP